MKRKFFITLLLISLFESSAFAALVPFTFSKLERVPTQNNIIKLSANETLPVSYDLREHGYVSAIRKQDPWGTCWAFGTLAAVETGYLLQHLSNDNFLNITKADDLKLSEIYVAWFAFMDSDRKNRFSVTDKKTNQLAKDPTYAQIFDNGGHITQALSLMTRGYGWAPIEEKTGLPYSDFATKSPDNAVAAIKSHDAYLPTALRVTEAVFMTNESSDIMFKEENRNEIKKLIMNKGGIAISYSAALNKRFLNRDSGAYFYSLQENSNEEGDNPPNVTDHTVAIIGWDDNYPVSNFSSQSIKPTKPGAWLVRNSWGDDWPNKTMGGYCWMSYEQYITYGTAFTVESTDKNIITYEYDPLGVCTAWGITGETRASAANVFKIRSEGETLKEISYYTTQNNAEVKIYIYNYGANHPKTAITTGTPIFTSDTITQPLAGYHTLKLTSPITTLKKGDYFGVVIDVKNPSNGFPIAAEARINGYSDFAAIFDGESYFYLDNSWFDGASNTEMSGDKKVSNPVNACIKAFTTTASTTPIPEPEEEDFTIAGIPVVLEPDYTVNDNYIESLNPVVNENSFKGRKISQILADNNGKAFPAGVKVGLTLMDMTEFYEDTPFLKTREQTGTGEIDRELDPLYDTEYTPDVFIYSEGAVFPSYVTEVTTSSDGSVIIDADKLNIPETYYSVIYEAKINSDDVIGSLRVIEITESEDVTPTPGSEDVQPIYFMKGSSSGCDSGLFAGFGGLLAILFAVKSREK